MKDFAIKWGRRLTASILVALITLAILMPVLGAESQPRVLRVAFPQVAGLTQTAEDGTRYGLVVDYLNEISKYTNWKYEYIDTTGETLLDEFAAGEYDIMGGNYYLQGLEKYYAYPDYNIGYSKSVLLARKDDTSIRSYDLESLNGKTIGVYERAKENIRRLKEFLSINNLDCTLKQYSYEELSPEGNLYPYLENGEVDVLLGNNAESADTMRVVALFDSQPYYIVTNVGNQEVLDGLNMALRKITESNPNFAAERYDANFASKESIEALLSKEELAYIQRKETVSVAVPNSFHPLFCLGSQDDMHDGLTDDILEEITRFSGLKFSYIYTDSYIEAIQMVQQGHADLLGFYLGNEEESVENGLALTTPYVSLTNIVLRNKATSFPADGLIGAALEGRDLTGEFDSSEMHYYTNIPDALSAVDRGQADFLYGLAGRLEWEMQRHPFNNLVPVTLVNDRSDVSLAMARPVEPDLLTILNKSINSLSEAQKAEILDRNMVSIGAGEYSLRDLIYANPILFIVILSVFLLLVVATVLWINRVRTKAAVMQSHLERVEAESRAKGEFLSRMSHEIRTPMNAVVGLADIITMTEGVPDGICRNLAKLQSSAHYLLDLINDILDMSRLDNGMLSIVSEPFSLGHMLSEIQAMMGPEAQKRSLKYTLEQQIDHSSVAGDEIRLRQVLTNLLSNAFKFTPAGGTVRLRVTETSGSDTDATFFFQVIDSGMGISPADQTRIFETFEQLGTNYSKSQGTGLGLPISQSIVQMMGGELCVASEPDHGSEFYFTITLPLGTASEEPEATPQAPEPDRSLDGNLLLAEDNDLNAEIAVQLLELRGMTVCRVENGKQAVERFAESKPGEFQLILMDIQMPEMNGLEATREIRALSHPDAKGIPIVAMTANTFKEDVDAALAAGMNGFLSKPLDVKHLYHLLSSFLYK